MKSVLIYFKDSGEISKVVDEETEQEIMWNGVVEEED